MEKYGKLFFNLCMYTYKCADESERLGADLLGDQCPGHDGAARADAVADDPAQADPGHVVEARQDDGGQLRAVAPLRQEGHGEAVHEEPSSENKEGN